MSGIYRHALTAKATIRCDARGCDASWESEPYAPGPHRLEERQVGPALELGWRIFVGGRSQYTYCPLHGPKVPMRLILGGDR